jgi:CheY-like chemotaxis protein
MSKFTIQPDFNQQGSFAYIAVFFRKKNSMSVRTILIIDDHFEIRKIPPKHFRWGIVPPRNGKRSQLALAEKPDLIVCDIMMPELDGWRIAFTRKTPKRKVYR